MNQNRIVLSNAVFLISDYKNGLMTGYFSVNNDFDAVKKVIITGRNAYYFYSNKWAEMPDNKQRIIY